MAIIPPKRVKAFWQISQNGQTTLARGRALEELICFVFAKVPGILITHRDAKNAFNTEEIDIAFWNEKNRRGFYFLPDVILVECKNWSHPVGSEEVNWFDSKLRNRGLTTGFLVAVNGITGNPDSLTDAHSIIAKAQSEQRRIILITLNEILSLSNSAELVLLIKQKLTEMAVRGTVLV